jgi:hypothetical protein
MSNTPSRLEVFPDELFLHLFSYIPPIELYSGWTDLNRRLDAILRSVQISFELNDTNAVAIQTLNYFSLQIVYLRVRVSYEALSLSKFSHLRSLIIDTKLSTGQLRVIRPKVLPQLKRLTFSDWRIYEESFNTVCCNLDATSDSQTPWINICHLPTLPSCFLSCRYSLSHIHTMIFDRVHHSSILFILSIRTQLRRLKVTVARWTPDDALTVTLPPTSMCDHEHLVHLDITLNTCNKLDDLYPLLSHLPRLRYLRVACDSLTINDFARLALELNTRLPWLARFTCSFKQTYVENVAELHRLSPLFQRMRCEKVDWGGGWHYYCVTTGLV